MISLVQNALRSGMGTNTTNLDRVMVYTTDFDVPDVEIDSP